MEDIEAVELVRAVDPESRDAGIPFVTPSNNRAPRDVYETYFSVWRRKVLVVQGDKTNLSLPELQKLSNAYSDSCWKPHQLSSAADLQKLLEREKPDMLLVVGHGNSDGALLLPGGGFLDLCNVAFMNSSNQPDFVFLNYCNSYKQLPKLSNYVRIGWSGEIGDDTAALAATTLFRALEREPFSAALATVQKIEAKSTLCYATSETKPRDSIHDAWSLGCLTTTYAILGVPANTIRWRIGISNNSIWPRGAELAKKLIPEMDRLLDRFGIPHGTYSVDALQAHFAINKRPLAAFKFGVHTENLYISLLILKKAYLQPNNALGEFLKKAEGNASAAMGKFCHDVEHFDLAKNPGFQEWQRKWDPESRRADWKSKPATLKPDHMKETFASLIYMVSSLLNYSH